MCLFKSTTRRATDVRNGKSKRFRIFRARIRTNTNRDKRKQTCTEIIFRSCGVKYLSARFKRDYYILYLYTLNLERISEMLRRRIINPGWKCLKPRLYKAKHSSLKHVSLISYTIVNELESNLNFESHHTLTAMRKNGFFLFAKRDEEIV